MLPGLTPGDQLLRRDLHARFGGRQQGGIGPSAKFPVVLFFTDPTTGHRHGYYDGWDDEGLFHYYGEGQKGDQRLVQGNKAILDHKAEGRTVEGFNASSGMVTYMGEFELVDHYFTDVHETDSDVLRQAVVFKLRPLGTVPVDLPHVPVTQTANPQVESVPVEEQHTERAFVNPDREPYEIERREASLVHRYKQYLQRKGHTVSRLRVVPPGEAAPLYSDLWDETARDLIEAKGNVTREQMRSAVGQLLDYGRFVEANTRTVLLPSCPRPDLLSFLQAAGVEAVYPDGNAWVRV